MMRTRSAREAAVVACPSHREGFGYVALEAMAHGKPVVASAVGGLLDLVVDEETGILVPPRDVPALRAALERLLADRGLRRRLGEAARRRAQERFSWDVVTDDTLAVYEEARKYSLGHYSELKQVFIAATKLPDAVVDKQLKERTELTHSKIGAPQRESILAAGLALQQAGVVKADVDVKATVDALIDPSVPLTN